MKVKTLYTYVNLISLGKMNSNKFFQVKKYFIMYISTK